MKATIEITYRDDGVYECSAEMEQVKSTTRTRTLESALAFVLGEVRWFLQLEEKEHEKVSPSKG